MDPAWAAHPMPGDFDRQGMYQRRPNRAPAFDHEHEPEEQQAPEPPRPRRHYPARKCRICLEEVQPTFDIPSGIAATLMGGPPKPKYVSEDPSLGRLMSPCRCKGTQKYVHEGCLEAWRHASYSDRNRWKCPTCGFEYHMERLSAGKLLSHWASSIILTVFVVAFIVFLLGFIGDKIIDLYLDPWGTMLYGSNDTAKSYVAQQNYVDIKKYDNTWGFHFLKGFFSLGIIGFVKSLLASSPFYYLNLGGGRRRRRGDARDRYMDISWWIIAFGVATFMLAVWKAVKSLTSRALDRFRERIVDVQHDDDDDEDGEPEETQEGDQDDNGRPKTE